MGVIANFFDTPMYVGFRPFIAYLRGPVEDMKFYAVFV